MSLGSTNSVSIVGLSFRVPGASDLEGLWSLLSGDREVVGPVPVSRYHLDAAAFERMRPGERPAAYFGAFLEDVESFDARHFQVSPVEARRMDPQQRLALQESWRALEDAGFDPRALKGSRTGVFVGSSNHDYSMSFSYDLPHADIFKVMGSALGMISNRISHFLDLRGPSLTVDTACSSAMVATHNAITSLNSKETDIALVGGINIINSPHLTVAFSRARMLSNTGSCKPFSDDADGYVRGEAVIFFTLMRTADALSQGRPIYAELLGSAVNQDGHTEVITAPNGDSQVAVITEALQKAGVSADQLSYLEAHGTGTQVGDRVEYESISRLLRTGKEPRRTPCIVGSAKTALGHAEPASGTVGILKTICSLRKDQVPRHHHFTSLNTHVVEDKEHISLALTNVPWPRGAGPRIAGISSFGFGGTNTHVILREAEGPPRAPGKVTAFQGKAYWKKDERPEQATSSVDQVVQELRTQVSEFLRGELPSVDKPLLELGIDSLDLFTLLQRAESKYGVKLSLERLLEPGTTLTSLAKSIASAEPAAKASASKPVDAFSMFSPQPSSVTGGEAAAVSAYTEKTKGSKQHTQATRAVLADNRNTAGFRPRTKEAAYPLVAERARGSKLWDVDGNEFIDFTMGFGVHLFGHAPPQIHAAVQEALLKGAPLGPQSPVAGEVARLMKTLTGLDRFTFTNSGTEAVMLACRLARAATKREKIVIFEGSYHGTFDGLLGRREGAEGEARPITPGTPNSMVSELVVLPWADPKSLEYLAKHGESLAAVLVEPVQSRRPGVQPKAFLEGLRAATTKTNTALIFDEVITGFRCKLGGAQEHFGVRADLAVYGKVLGGGFPIGAVGGSAKFLDRVDGGFWSYGDNSAPSYELVFFAGTFCKHPLAMAAARATLQSLNVDLLSELNRKTEALCTSLNSKLGARGVPLECVWFGSLFRLQSTSNLDLLFTHLNASGIYVWEGRNLFLSTAHDEADLQAFGEKLLSAAEKTLGRLEVSPAQERFLALPKGSRAGNVGFAMQLDGVLDVPRFERAVHTVIERHEIFSAQFDGHGALRFGGPSRALVSVTRPKELAARLNELSMEVLDPAQGPLARVELIERAPAEHCFVVLTHGVLLDAYSLAVLVHELAQAYRGLLPQVPGPQYREYLQFVRSRDSSGEGFWKELFPRGLPPPLFVESSAPPKANRVKRLINKVDQQRIEAAAREAGVTTFMYLFTRFSCALAKLTKKEEFAIAVPFADRRFPGGEQVVGNLTQLMVVPQRAGDFASVSKSNAELLPRCYERAAWSMSALKPEGLQVLFNLEPTVRLPSLGSVRLSEVDFPRPEARFELSVHILESEDGLRIDLDYLERALSRETVEALAAALSA